MSDLEAGQFSIDDLENVQITIGKIVGAIEKKAKEEGVEVGPTPKPGISGLRDWDYTLLSRYQPVYTPVCDQCCYCTFGKCDLSHNKEGACGINMEAHQARETLLRVITGCCSTCRTRTSHPSPPDTSLWRGQANRSRSIKPDSTKHTGCNRYQT